MRAVSLSSHDVYDIHTTHMIGVRAWGSSAEITHFECDICTCGSLHSAALCVAKLLQIFNSIYEYLGSGVRKHLALISTLHSIINSTNEGVVRLQWEGKSSTDWLRAGLVRAAVPSKGTELPKKTQTGLGFLVLSLSS